MLRISADRAVACPGDDEVAQSVDRGGGIELAARDVRVQLKLPANDEFITALRQSIHAAIHAATPNLDVVAMRMCCSPRTLQRRLDDRGLKFQLLLDDARLQLAKRYLSKVGTPLSEVALLLGYAEQSAFNHAFKRWTGVTPKVWREKNAALGATPW